MGQLSFDASILCNLYSSTGCDNNSSSIAQQPFKMFADNINKYVGLPFQKGEALQGQFLSHKRFVSKVHSMAENALVGTIEVKALNNNHFYQQLNFINYFISFLAKLKLVFIVSIYKVFFIYSSVY